MTGYYSQTNTNLKMKPPSHNIKPLKMTKESMGATKRVGAKRC